MPTMYLSYAPGDREFGRGIRDALLRRGYEVIAPDVSGDAQPTQTALAEQRELMRRSMALIIVLTPLALSSPQVLDAMAEGSTYLIAGSKPVLSLVLGDGELDSTSVPLDYAVALARLYQYRIIVRPETSFDEVATFVVATLLEDRAGQVVGEETGQVTEQGAGQGAGQTEAVTVAEAKEVEEDAERDAPAPPEASGGWNRPGGDERAAEKAEERADEAPPARPGRVSEVPAGRPPGDTSVAREITELPAPPPPSPASAVPSPTAPPSVSGPPPARAPAAAPPSLSQGQPAPLPSDGSPGAGAATASVADTVVDTLRQRAPLGARRASAGSSAGSSAGEGEPLRFSAYHPNAVATQEWATLLVYSHIAAVLAQVQADAATFTELGSNPTVAQGTASRVIAEGVELTIEPHMEGVTFAPTTDSFVWRGDWHRSHFRFSGVAALAGAVQGGWLDIYADGLIPIARLDLSIPFHASGQEPYHAPQGLMVTGNVHDRVFISYSHADGEAFEQARATYNRFGIQVYSDDLLAAGDDYATELGKMIAAANVFHLLWSRRAAASVECRQEWEQALLREPSERFIKPWFWKRPLATPPAEFTQHHISFRYQHLRRKWWKPATW